MNGKFYVEIFNSLSSNQNIIRTLISANSNNAITINYIENENLFNIESCQSLLSRANLSSAIFLSRALCLYNSHLKKSINIQHDNSLNWGIRNCSAQEIETF